MTVGHEFSATRDELSSAIASHSNKTMQPTCEDARG